jgi:hypothetical protein
LEVIHGDDLFYWPSASGIYRFVEEDGSRTDYPTVPPLRNDILVSSSCTYWGTVRSDPDSDQYYLRCGRTSQWFNKDNEALELPAGYALVHVGKGGHMLLLDGFQLGVYVEGEDVLLGQIPDAGFIRAVRAINDGFWVVMESGMRYTIHFDGSTTDDGFYPGVNEYCELDADGKLICITEQLVTVALLGKSAVAEHPEVLHGHDGSLATGP